MKKVFIFAVLVMLAGMLSAQTYQNWGVVSKGSHKQTAEERISGCVFIEPFFEVKTTTYVSATAIYSGISGQASGQIVIRSEDGKFETRIDFPSGGTETVQASIPPGKYSIISTICGSGSNALASLSVVFQ